MISRYVSRVGVGGWVQIDLRNVTDTAIVVPTSGGGMLLALLGRCWDEIGLDSYLLCWTLASTNSPAFAMKNARPRDARRHHRRRARTTVAGAAIFTRRPG
jgi:hypothetical protein